MRVEGVTVKGEGVRKVAYCRTKRHPILRIDVVAIMYVWDADARIYVRRMPAPRALRVEWAGVWLWLLYGFKLGLHRSPTSLPLHRSPTSLPRYCSGALRAGCGCAATSNVRSVT